MATYILLLNLTPEGRIKMLDDAESVLRAGSAISTPEMQVLGLYGVLGPYDFVCVLEAPDNEAAARFSIALGVRAGLLITTLPAIPIGRLEGAEHSGLLGVEAGVGRTAPEAPEDMGEINGPPAGAPS